jgi:hypothetical protein
MVGLACLEVDVARQGESEQEALANLKVAIELHSNRRKLRARSTFLELRPFFLGDRDKLG